MFSLLIRHQQDSVAIFKTWLVAEFIIKQETGRIKRLSNQAHIYYHTRQIKVEYFVSVIILRAVIYDALFRTV